MYCIHIGSSYIVGNHVSKISRNNTKNLIKQIPSAPSKEVVYNLLQQIRDTNNNGIKEWVDYYQQSYTSVNKSGVPYTHRDRSKIKRTQESITRKESVIDLTNDELPTKSSLKRSSVNRNKSLKKSKQEKSEEISTMNEISQLEIEERKMALRELAAEVRKKEAEAEALEIANSQRRKENESFI
ncbi:hypothetical protein RhiirA5_497055 [Rhizophagus irregularis]|uniref:Uncharacterized protein n=1 Tax=Rhizophagus irregularis TaxID=588596 RepID=A0A2N0PZN0_9GLOM|nr:hypothetical protein RhiirA5_497055 [Rhizophagus irregularis]